VKRHFAFFNTPAMGHLAPTLGVVEELVRRGHRVTYAATKDYAELVGATGATVLPYESQIDPQRIVPPGAPDWLARVLMGSVRESECVAAVADEHFADDIPDLLAYDISVQFGGGVLGRKWNRPRVKFYSVSPTNRRIPREYVGEGYDEIVSRLQAFAADYGVTGVDFDEFVADPEAMNIVSVPKAFQFQSDEFDDTFAFVGPCLRAHDFEGDWQPPANGHPVVLITLGTSFNEQPDFFRACADAFADQPWHVVMALGPGMTAESIGELPPNVETHPWISMQTVLKHTAVFVCQGGNGTIMQSLYSGTPLVIVPQVGETDQLADQIRDLHLGEVFHRDDVTGERIRDAVLRLHADETVQRSIRDMRTHVREAGGATRAADEILAHVDRHR
jgi:MGT family glycosyltransferase